MSATQIPNLQTLRKNAPRGRGRGGDVPSFGAGPRRRPASKDEIIQGTDNDAATSRLSAVQAGYLDDSFAVHMVKSETSQRRLPLMNRGEFTNHPGEY